MAGISVLVSDQDGSTLKSGIIIISGTRSEAVTPLVMAGADHPFTARNIAGVMVIITEVM